MNKLRATLKPTFAWRAASWSGLAPDLRCAADQAPGRLRCGAAHGPGTKPLRGNGACGWWIEPSV